MIDNAVDLEPPAVRARRLGRAMLVFAVLGLVLAYPIVLIRIGVPVIGVVATETALVLLGLATAKKVLVLVGFTELSTSSDESVVQDQQPQALAQSTRMAIVGEPANLEPTATSARYGEMENLGQGDGPR
jgi:hypothetical protein